jgi:hypothetical protein
VILLRMGSDYRHPSSFRIREDHGRLVEWDAVLANVGRGLSSVPLEHRSYIQKWRQHWKRTLNIAS